MFQETFYAIMDASGGLRMGFLFVLVCLPANRAWADLEI